MDQGKIITAVVSLAVMAATVRADMMPVSGSDAGYLQASLVGGRTSLPQASPARPPFGCSGAFALGLGSLDFLLKANADVTQTGETRNLQVLARSPGSLSLCLYALLGLGLCRSAPFVKKLSLGCLPDWYHTGGPFQIGHSHALSPDCLCPAPVYCFVQPDGRVEDPISQYRQEIVISLWRKSQFTPSVLASRGPPCLS